jgi:putative transposase
MSSNNPLFTGCILRNGFVYLTAVIDWCSRYVLAWRLSTTLETTFCKEALEEALAKYGKPEIFNTDQGSQFTSDEFTAVLLTNEIAISMDGRGRALDNVFVERLWRTVKYENVYLNDYGSVTECHRGLSAFFQRYNNRREHQSLDYKFPAEVYFGNVAAVNLAA